MDLLAERITESINDLALQIDVLHKLSETDRQSFLNKIQSFKTSLLGLKSNLKVSNKELVESQYKGVRSQIIQMKRFLEIKLQDLKFKNANQQNRSIHQNRLNSCKIGHRTGSITKVNQSLFDTSNMMNKSQITGSRIGVMKHISKKEYQDLMKNIVEKTQAHEQLTQELATFRQENTELKDINEALKAKAEHFEKEKESLQIRYNNLSSQFEIVERKLKQKQREAAQLKENDLENRTRNSRSALEISQLKNQLDSVTQKLMAYSNFQEVQSYKASLLQQDISKYQRQIALLNQGHQSERLELQKKITQLQAYKDSYTQTLRKISRLQAQLQNQRQDIQVLESQLNKSQKQYYEMKIQKESVETKLQQERKLFDEKQTEKNKELDTVKEMLIDSEQFNSIKQMEISALKAKLSQWQEAYLEQRLSRQNLQQNSTKRLTEFQKQRQAYICDLQLKKLQITRLSDQVKKSLELTRSLQQQINQNHVNRTRIRDDNKLLSNDLKDVEIKNIELTKSYQELKQMYLEAIERLNLKETQLDAMKKTMTVLESQLKEAKIRLHKAKIEAINDIRNTLF